ncbi:hypothetical protein ACFL6E_05305 [Candidatus Neomarinimicrobiota bacterium]
MDKYHLQIFTALLLMLATTQAQTVKPRTKVGRYSYFMPVTPSDGVFIGKNMRFEYNWKGYASFFGQLSLKRGFNLFKGTEFGIGLGFPYVVVNGKTALKEYDTGILMLAIDYGLLLEERDLNPLATLGKIGFAYGQSLNRDIDRKLELGYAWYDGHMDDLTLGFPRSRVVYGTVSFERDFGGKISFSIFGGLILAYQRYMPPQGSVHEILDWDYDQYVTLNMENREPRGTIFRWTQQWGINVGVTLKYHF